MLQAGNVILRSLRESDKLRLAALADNRKVSEYLRDYFPSPYELKDAELFVSQVKDQEPVTNFAIEYDNDFCGVISLIQQSDIYRKSAEIGYWLGEPFWNKGIISKAVELITDYGFNQLDLIRIYAGIFETNTGSIRVLEKNGYIRDGVFLDALIKNGQIFTEVRYSITKSNHPPI